MTIRASPKVPRILIFSQISDERDPIEVFTHLTSALHGAAIDHVIFTTYKTDQGADLLMGKEFECVSMKYELANCDFRPKAWRGENAYSQHLHEGLVRSTSQFYCNLPPYDQRRAPTCACNRSPKRRNADVDHWFTASCRWSSIFDGTAKVFGLGIRSMDTQTHR
jgi:hypothetical protein